MRHYLFGGLLTVGVLVLTFGMAWHGHCCAQEPLAKPGQLYLSGATGTMVSEQLPVDRAALLTALQVKARALIPELQAKEHTTFAKYQSDYEVDKAAYKFRVEKFGDFISMFIERQGNRTIQAVNVGVGTTIVLHPGRQPDMKGESQFCGYGVEKKGRSDLGLSIKINLSDGEKWIGETPTSWSVHSVGILSLQHRPDFQHGDITIYPDENTTDDGVIGVQLTSIAEKAQDDQIIIGGERQDYNTVPSDEVDIYTKTSTYSGATCAPGGSCFVSALPPRSGLTLSLPAGLGSKVYADIMAAMKANAIALPPPPK